MQQLVTVMCVNILFQNTQNQYILLKEIFVQREVVVINEALAIQVLSHYSASAGHGHDNVSQLFMSLCHFVAQ